MFIPVDSFYLRESQSNVWSASRQLEETMDLLFPNQTALYRRSLESSDEELYQRHLQTTDDNTGTSNAGIPEPCAEPFIPSAGTPADFDGAVSCSADICGSVCRGNDAQLRKDCGCVKCKSSLHMLKDVYPHPC